LPPKVKIVGGVRTLPADLELIDSNQVTVSSTVLPITSFFADIVGKIDEVEMVSFQVESGGGVRVNSLKPLTAGGTEGSKKLQAGDEWDVTGKHDILQHEVVRATGGSDATVNCWLFKKES